MSLTQYSWLSVNAPIASRWHRIAMGVMIPSAYATLALFYFRHLLGGLSSRVPLTSYSGDVGTGVWYMAWLPFALGHGIDPFVSHFQFAPAGFNLLSNTGDLLPSLVLSPVTVLFGPVASFNVAVISAPVISAGSLYYVVRKIGISAPAAFVAGALYGYSPYLIHEEPFGHLNLTWMFFPPLAYYLLDRILCVQSGSPYRYGAGLGILVVAQYFTSTEILLDCALVAAPLVVIFSLQRIREVGRVLPYALTATGVACLIIVPLLAYPFWVTVAGPYHVLAVRSSFSGVINLRSPVWPSAPTAGGLLQRADSGFIGPGALIVALSAAIWWRRVRNVAHFVAGAAVSYVLALGPTIKTAGGLVVSRVSPISALDHLPLFRAIEDYRFSALLVMFVAMLAAVAIDRMAAALAQRAKAQAVSLRVAAYVLVLGAAVLVFPILAGNVPGTVQQVSLPAGVVRALPARSVSPTLELYPAAGLFEGAPLVWQALSGLRFKLTSGYAFIPGPPGLGGSVPFYAPATATNLLFAAASLGTLQRHVSASALAAVSIDLARSGVSSVAISLQARDGLLLATNLALLLGPPTYHSSTLWGWDDLVSHTARSSDEAHPDKHRLHLPLG